MTSYVHVRRVLERGLVMALTFASSGVALAQQSEVSSAPAPQVPAPGAEVPAVATEGLVIEAGNLYLVAGGQKTAVALPGPAGEMVVSGDHAFVALGELGAAVVRLARQDEQLTAVVEKVIPVSHGAVTGFMVQGDAVWMQVSSMSAIRVQPGAATALVTPVEGTAVAVVAPAVAPVPEASLQPKEAEASAAIAGLNIIKIFDGKVLLNRGKASGLRVGDRFKVVRSEQNADEAGTYEGEHEVAVVVVESLSADSARAAIWRGDQVAAGDHIEPADNRTDPSLLYPRQLHDFVEFEAHVRPILNIGAAGFGVLMDDHITYFGELYYLGLRNEPFGLGRTQNSTAFTQTTYAEGGYNSRPFAIGLAAGFTSVYGDLQEMFQITSSDAATAGPNPTTWPAGQPEMSDWKQDMQHAFALGQRVRLGALDGMNLVVANTLLYFPGGGRSVDGTVNRSGFIWGGTDAKLTIPLAQRADMFVEGGGGVIGYAYGAVGVFGWLSGNGGPGSLGLMASAGGAGVWSTRTRQNYRYNYTDTDDIIVAGPMVSLGLRYRASLGGD